MGTFAYDAKLDIVYVPTGVGTPDIWGGDRTELKERYANSMLAINATTGKLFGISKPHIMICGIWMYHHNHLWRILKINLVKRFLQFMS
jgi:hypothetical protein